MAWKTNSVFHESSSFTADSLVRVKLYYLHLCFLSVMCANVVIYKVACNMSALNWIEIVPNFYFRKKIRFSNLE